MDRRSATKYGWRLAVVAGAFLLIGAATPARCSSKLSTDTLAGPATKATREDVADDPCPEYESLAGAEPLTLRGDREVWKARIAAPSAPARLFVAPCLQEGSRTVRDIANGPFVIQTKWGKVHGEVSGLIDSDWREATGFKDFFRMKLDITKGTWAYRNATGVLWYSGCLEGDGILAAAVTTTQPSGPPSACLEPAL